MPKLFWSRWPISMVRITTSNADNSPASTCWRLKKFVGEAGPAALGVCGAAGLAACFLRICLDRRYMAAMRANTTRMLTMIELIYNLPQDLAYSPFTTKLSFGERFFACLTMGP